VSERCLFRSGNIMEIPMAPRILAAAMICAMLALSACTPPESAGYEESVSLTGTVTSIDTASRRVVIEGPERTVLFRVSDEARNFDQVEVGDRVTLDYVESVAVAMADPEDSGEPLVDVFGVRAPEGQRPGMAGAMIGTVVVELVDYDPRTHVARIRGPEGNVTPVNVAPELRRFAATRQPGDRVLVLVEEAVAVNVTPAG
jgi:hypothetical protein